MKTCSAATRALLATGKALKAELYVFTLASGVAYRYTTSQQSLSGITGFAGQPFATGLVIERSTLTQKTGLAVQGLKVKFSPIFDALVPPVVAGLPFLQACSQRVFDGARVSMYKLFLATWSDLSPGAPLWFPGRVNQVVTGRASAEFDINSDMEMLNTQMPPTIVQTSCTHTLFDAGCTLNPATFKVAGTVAAGATVLSIPTSLTQVDRYFELGRLIITSGVNNGLQRLISTYVRASGRLTLVQPLPAVPGAGDTFTVLPGCKKTQAACGNTNPAVGPPFNNLIHFRGFPYIPVPETLYDGGTAAGANAGPIGGGGHG